MAKTNLCIVALSKQFADNVCKQLSSKLDMFYADIEEIFAYDLIDIGKVEKVCGIDYLEKEKKSIIKRVCGYENTLVNIDYILLNNEEILNIIKSTCVIVYLQMNSENYNVQQQNENLSNNMISINNDVFNERDILLCTESDIIVDVNCIEKNKIINVIFEKILKYYS